MSNYLPYSVLVCLDMRQSTLQWTYHVQLPPLLCLVMSRYETGQHAMSRYETGQQRRHSEQLINPPPPINPYLHYGFRESGSDLEQRTCRESFLPAVDPAHGHTRLMANSEGILFQVTGRTMTAPHKGVLSFSRQCL